MPYNHRHACALQPQTLPHITVNVHGREAKNILADLYMEHLNRECKMILARMGSNNTEEPILCVSHALKPLTTILSSFDLHKGVSQESAAHTVKSNTTDQKNI